MAYADYVETLQQQEEVIRSMTVERIRELARQYADPERMHYLIAGDAATQFERLRDFPSASAIPSCWPADYVLKQEEVIRSMTVERIRRTGTAVRRPRTYALPYSRRCRSSNASVNSHRRMLK
jgi:hypothetical protein